MEAREAIMLCRYVQALCPAQKFDQYTPDAWLDALGQFPYQLAKRAALQCAATGGGFVSPSDITAMIRSMRRAVRPHIRRELDAIDEGSPDDPDEDFVAWSRQRNQRIAKLADEAIMSENVTWEDGQILEGRTVFAIPIQLPMIERPPLVDRRREMRALLSGMSKGVEAA